MKHVLFVLVGTLLATVAHAQVTYVNPTPNGGYIINRPGSSVGPTYVNPTPNGGFIANTPGSSYGPTYGNPTPNGGMIINTPGAYGSGGMYGQPYGGGMYGR